MHWQSKKIAEKNIKATEKKKFQYFTFEVHLTKILKLEHLVSPSFSKTFFTFYANKNTLQDLL